MISHNATANAIHGPLDARFDQDPIGAAGGEVEHLFGAEDGVEAIGVGDDGGEFFGVGRIDEVELRQFAEGVEIRQERGVFERLDEVEVVRHVAVSLFIVRENNLLA